MAATDVFEFLLRFAQRQNGLDVGHSGIDEFKRTFELMFSSIVGGTRARADQWARYAAALGLDVPAYSDDVPEEMRDRAVAAISETQKRLSELADARTTPAWFVVRALAP